MIYIKIKIDIKIEKYVIIYIYNNKDKQRNAFIILFFSKSVLIDRWIEG